MAQERALYNANDGLTGRGGGPYLDLEEQRLAEERRARIEGREPNYENPGASAGTVLLTADQVLANAGVNNLPSNDTAGGSSSEAALKALADDPTNNLRVHAVLPATEEEEVVEDDLSTRAALATDGSAGPGEPNTPDLPPVTSDAPAQPNVSQAPAVAANPTNEPQVAEVPANAPAV